MKTLSKLLEEKMIQSNPDKLDMDWINNDKPVITKSGYEVRYIQQIIKKFQTSYMVKYSFQKDLLMDGYGMKLANALLVKTDMVMDIDPVMMKRY